MGVIAVLFLWQSDSVPICNPSRRSENDQAHSTPVSTNHTVMVRSP